LLHVFTSFRTQHKSLLQQKKIVGRTNVVGRYDEAGVRQPESPRFSYVNCMRQANGSNRRERRLWTGYVEQQNCDVHSDRKIKCIFRKEQSGCDAPGRKYTAT